MTRMFRPASRLFAVALALILAGCAATRPAGSGLPAWQGALIVAESSHPEAPALGMRGEQGWLIAWAQDSAIMARSVALDGTPGAAQPVITGRQPWAPALFPGPGGEWHLLWRDLDALGEARIYSAHLDPAGALLRGPVAITPEGISTYSAAPGADDSLLLLWAEAALQPDIYAQRLDAEGRLDATPPILIARRAEHPALARTADGTWVMSWLAWPDLALRDSASREVMVATSAAALPWQAFGTPQRIATLTSATHTEYVETAPLGLDHTHGYRLIGWRDAATGLARIDVLSFALRAPGDATRTRLTLPVRQQRSAAEIETGFNTGPAQAWSPPTEEALAASWPQPAAGQLAALPVALSTAEGPAIAYLEGGQVRAFQLFGTADAPARDVGVWIDRDRHVTLAWSAFDAAANGNALLFATTRPDAPG